MKKRIRLTEGDIHNMVKTVIRMISEGVMSKEDEKNAAWDEYNKYNKSQFPSDESDYDRVLNKKGDSSFGKAYCHSVTKDGVVDPMVFKVKSNTLRGMMG